MLQHCPGHDVFRRTGNLETVAVDKDREVVETVLRPGHGPFPNGTFITFAVA